MDNRFISHKEGWKYRQPWTYILYGALSFSVCLYLLYGLCTHLCHSSQNLRSQRHKCSQATIGNFILSRCRQLYHQFFRLSQHPLHSSNNIDGSLHLPYQEENSSRLQFVSEGQQVNPQRVFSLQCESCPQEPQSGSDIFPVLFQQQKYRFLASRLGSQETWFSISRHQPDLSNLWSPFQGQKFEPERFQ